MTAVTPTRPGPRHHTRIGTERRKGQLWIYDPISSSGSGPLSGQQSSRQVPSGQRRSKPGALSLPSAISYWKSRSWSGKNAVEGSRRPAQRSAAAQQPGRCPGRKGLEAGDAPQEEAAVKTQALHTSVLRGEGRTPPRRPPASSPVSPPLSLCICPLLSAPRPAGQPQRGATPHCPRGRGPRPSSAGGLTLSF